MRSAIVSAVALFALSSTGAEAADFEVPKNVSAKERKAMAAAKIKSKVTAKKVAAIKAQYAALHKKEESALKSAAKMKKQAAAVMKKMPKCAQKMVDVDVKKADVDKNTAKAKALAAKEAGKRGKAEHDTVVKHGRAAADKASKALIMEEHDALHGKLQKEILAIATAEATAAAPKAAKREVGVYHRQIAAKVRAEVAALVLKDATKTARGLAMKEVESQMGKSKKVKALVASVAKDAAKYFAHKFSGPMLEKLSDEEAHKQAGAAAGRHADAVLGKAEADAKGKVAGAAKKPVLCPMTIKHLPVHRPVHHKVYR